VDTIEPVVTITSPSDGQNLSSATVDIIFTTVDMTRDKTWYVVDSGTPVVVSGSSFQVTLPDGLHSIAVYCNDSFGRIGFSSVHFTLDTSAPVITVNNPSSGAMLSSGNVSINVEVSDPNLDGIWYVFDGEAPIMLFSNTSIAVDDGLHTITIFANDLFGHTTSVSRTFTVDTAAPVVVITSPPDGANLSSATLNVTFMATDLTKDETWYIVDGGARVFVPGGSFSLPVADGAHTVYVYCNDSFGRVSSDLIHVTIDTTAPSIAVTGFAGLSIEQGDVEYLNWTLLDVHPSTYAVYLNRQMVRSGSYSSGANVSILIDSVALGVRNYTLIVQDTFGNVQRHERLITVLTRTDGGIFLSVGVNLVSQHGAYALDLTLNMSHWAILYLNIAASVTTISNILPAALPSGLVIAVPVAFNLNITNSSALLNGFIRVYYSQSLIANQVNEADLEVLHWDEDTGEWVTSTAGMSLTQNYIDIGLSVNGLYVIASTPKQNYVPIIIIVLIGITGGIVAVASYGYSRKKKVQHKATGKSKASQLLSYTTVPAPPSEIHDAALAKRARLMQAPVPGTIPQRNEAMLGTEAYNTWQIEGAKKKAGISTEPDVDIAARAASAQGMASEVSVETVVPRCVVHKGPISGLSYTCKQCGVQYCIDCAAHLAKSGEKCWNCGADIDTQSVMAVNPQAIPERQMEGQVTMFGPEIFAKISELGIEEGLVDDLLELLKDIPVDNRVQYLEEMFKEMPENEDDSL